MICSTLYSGRLFEYKGETTCKTLRDDEALRGETLQQLCRQNKRRSDQCERRKESGPPCREKYCCGQIVILSSTGVIHVYRVLM